MRIAVGPVRLKLNPMLTGSAADAAPVNVRVASAATDKHCSLRMRLPNMMSSRAARFARV